MTIQDKHSPMQGFRVLELSRCEGQATLAAVAGAVLADWGADVIKINHGLDAEALDQLREHTEATAGKGAYDVLMDHANRSKRSVGIAIDGAKGRELLQALIRSSDVFLTNFTAVDRQRLGFDVDQVRSINPAIVYARATSTGARGPEADRGGSDAVVWWNRSGAAYGCSSEDMDGMCDMPWLGHGDNIAGTNLAGGVAAALFARERTGEASIVDTSLLSSAAWTLGNMMAGTLANGQITRPALLSQPPLQTHPLSGDYMASDGKWLRLGALQASRYWADFCRHIERDDLAVDPRFTAPGGLLGESGKVAIGIVTAELRKRPLAEWIERFKTLEAQWAVVQGPADVCGDPQLRANGHIAEYVAADGRKRELVVNPIQFNETPVQITRPPKPDEHTADVLGELGYSPAEAANFAASGAVRLS